MRLDPQKKYLRMFWLEAFGNRFDKCSQIESGRNNCVKSEGENERQ